MFLRSDSPRETHGRVALTASAFWLLLVSASFEARAESPDGDLGAALRRLGYRASVADQIAASEPRLAAQIVDMARARTRLGARDEQQREYFTPNAAAWVPVTLYRGIGRSTFDPQHYSHRFHGDAFMSTGLYPPINYARSAKNKGPYGLMLELQVPRFLVRLGGRRTRWPVLPADVASLLPFVRRVGEVNVGRGGEARRPADDIRWQAPGATASYIRRRASTRRLRGKDRAAAAPRRSRGERRR